MRPDIKPQHWPLAARAPQAAAAIAAAGPAAVASARTALAAPHEDLLARIDAMEHLEGAGYTLDLTCAFERTNVRTQSQTIELSRLEHGWLGPAAAGADRLEMTLRRGPYTATARIDWALVAGARQGPGDAELVIDAARPPEPGALAPPITAALAAQAHASDWSTEELDAHVAGLIERTLRAARNEPKAEGSASAQRYMHAVADAGQVRIHTAGEGAALMLDNGYGDGRVDIIVGPDGPLAQTQPTAGLTVHIMDPRTGASSYDCRYAWAGSIPLGCYEVRRAATTSAPLVWLRPRPPPHGASELSLTPSSGGWRAEIGRHRRAPTPAAAHGVAPIEPETVISFITDTADCHLAEGAVHVHSAGAPRHTMRPHRTGARLATVERATNGSPAVRDLNTKRTRE